MWKNNLMFKNLCVVKQYTFLSAKLVVSLYFPSIIFLVKKIKKKPKNSSEKNFLLLCEANQ